MPSPFTRTLRLKVRPESYGWLNAAAVEVNQTFNFCNEASWLAATRTDSKRKWLSGFDLCGLTSGASRYFERIGADTIQRICVEYARKREAAKPNGEAIDVRRNACIAKPHVGVRTPCTSSAA